MSREAKAFSIPFSPRLLFRCYQCRWATPRRKMSPVLK